MATPLRTRIWSAFSRLAKPALTLSATLIAVGASSCGPPPPELTGTVRFQYGCRMDSTCLSGAAALNGRQNDGTPPLNVSCRIDRTSTPGTVRFRIRAYRGTGSSIDSAQQGLAICGEVPAGTTGGMTAVQNSKVDLYFSGTQILQQSSATCPVYVSGLTPTSIEGQFKCEGAGDNSTPRRLFYVSGTEDSQNMTVSPEFGDFLFTTCTPALVPSCM